MSLSLNKCRKCKKPADYTHPDLLCEEHWIEWWIDGMEPKNAAEREQLTKECREAIKRR